MIRRRQGDVLLAIAVGGALGSLARYGIAVALPYADGAFATATLLVNILGSAVLGALMTTVTQLARRPRLLRPFLGTGFCGGFTTFSTYVLDTITSSAAGRPLVAVLYALCSLAASVAAVGAGMLAARRALARGQLRHGAETTP